MFQSCFSRNILLQQTEQMKKISVSLELNSRPTKSQGNLHNILIRVTKDRKSRRYSTEFYISLKHWEKEDKKVIGGRRGSLNAGSINDKLDMRLQRLRLWLGEQRDKKTDLSLEQVLLELKGEVPETTDNSFFEFAEQIVEQKRLVQYDSYMNALSRLKNFREYCATINIEKLSMADCGYRLLKDYQQYLISKGKRAITVNTYVNFVKEILRKALPYFEGEVQADVLHKVETIKRSRSRIKEKLTTTELSKLEKADAETEWQNHARNIFLFCYYLLGARIRDALTMRYKKVEGDTITYIMGKNKKIMVVEKHAKLRELLKPYMDQAHEEDDFIFPFLKREQFELLNEEKQTHKLHSKASLVNYHLKKLVKKAGISKHVTSHIARHSFGMHYFEETQDLQSTSQLMGHGEYSTTDRYLKQQGVLNNSKKAKKFYDKED